MKLRSILNKVTPQKFRVLMEQIFELMREVTTVEKLKGIVNLIFEKVRSVLSIGFNLNYIYRNCLVNSCAFYLLPTPPDAHSITSFPVNRRSASQNMLFPMDIFANILLMYDFS